VGDPFWAYSMPERFDNWFCIVSGWPMLSMYLRETFMIIGFAIKVSGMRKKEQALIFQEYCNGL